MNVGFESPKPEIHVYEAGQGVNPSALNEILLGIEEENVPYSMDTVDNVDNATVVAYKAALSSHLGVGIGVTSDEIVLHFSKLNEDQPLFKIEMTKNSDRLRSIGSNAARLVKRMPFKDLD